MSIKWPFLDDNCWLTVELTNICDLNCPACSQKLPPEIPRKFMDFVIFQKVIDDLCEKKVEFSSINPFFRGESLLHPDFPKILNYIREKCKIHPLFQFVVLHTNGNRLWGENADAILDLCDQQALLHPGNLIISLDAVKEETYNLVRPGGSLPRVVKNIQDFLTKRRDKNQWGPDLLLQFIIQENNEKEAWEFAKFWADILEEYSHKPFRVAYSVENQPFRVDGDLIYFRQLETGPEKQALEKARYLRIIEELGKLSC